LPQSGERRIEGDLKISIGVRHVGWAYQAECNSLARPFWAQQPPGFQVEEAMAYPYPNSDFDSEAIQKSSQEPSPVKIRYSYWDSSQDYCTPSTDPNRFLPLDRVVKVMHLLHFQVGLWRVHSPRNRLLLVLNGLHSGLAE
jgi:hypothetical protein